MLFPFLGLGICMNITDSINIAIENKSDKTLLNKAQMLYVAKAPATECHYDDIEYCAEHKPSILIKTFSYNKMGGHVDGTHTHYNKPSNVNYAIRIINPPAKMLSGKYDLEISKNGHYDNRNSKDERAVEDESDESSEYTRRATVLPTKPADKYDIHKYNNKKGETPVIYMMYAKKFIKPGE